MTVMPNLTILTHLGALKEVDASSDEEDDGDDVDENPELALGRFHLGHGDGVRNNAGARVLALRTELVQDPFVESVNLKSK